MKIHYLQHVPFEDLGSIKNALDEKGHQLSSTQLYENPIFPSIEDIDWLIILGGPMGIYDETLYPWLRTEKKFIKEAIHAGKKMLGICLGAQLIAAALGAKVYKNAHREIGWFSINKSAAMENTILSSSIPQNIQAFHWHGDTFDIPDKAIHLGESDACKNQGFILDDKIVALQFHLETTPQSARKLIENCTNELDNSKYVQTENQILSDNNKFIKINRIMLSIMEALRA